MLFQGFLFIAKNVYYIVLCVTRGSLIRAQRRTRTPFPLCIGVHVCMQHFFRNTPFLPYSPILCMYATHTKTAVVLSICL